MVEIEIEIELVPNLSLQKFNEILDHHDIQSRNCEHFDEEDRDQKGINTYYGFLEHQVQYIPESHLITRFRYCKACFKLLCPQRLFYCDDDTFVLYQMKNYKLQHIKSTSCYNYLTYSKKVDEM